MKNPVLKKAIALAMGASLAVSIPVMAASGDEVVKDGTYTKVTKVINDGRDDNDGEWSDYDLTVTLSVKDGKIESISGKPGSTYVTENDAYYDKAMTKRNGINTKLKNQDATENTVKGWDTVSTATLTSEAAKQAVLDIIAEAPVAGKEEPTQDDAKTESVYVMMNIPYDAFYSAQDAKNYDTDAMSSATNKVGNTGFAGGGYHSGQTANIKEDGTVEAVGGENGAHMEGVTWPVKAASIDAVKALGGTEVTADTKVTVATAGHGAVSSSERTGADALMEAPSYSYYVLANEPAYYLELSGDAKAPEFSALKGEARKQDKLDVEANYGSHWGDVELNLGTLDGVTGKKVNAIVLTADDGTQGGLVHLYNVWKSTDLAWDTDKVTGLDGKKLVNARFYLTDTNNENFYVLDYPLDVDLLPVYNDGATAELTDEKTVEFTGLPADLKNPKAVVSITEGSKGDRKTTYLTSTYIDPADNDTEPNQDPVKDNKVALTTAAEEGKTYTISISSDNYAPITLSARIFNGGYVLMNVPYDAFYGSAGTSNLDADAMSSATNKVGNVGKAGGGYHSIATAKKNEDGTYTAVGGENGAHMEGVTWPVKVGSLADLKALKGNVVTDDSKVTVATLGRGATSSTVVEGAGALMEAPSYSYYALSAEPAQYLELTVKDGKASFSGNKGEVTTLDKLDVNVSYGTNWGDVQFDFDQPEAINGKQLNAMVITAEDGKNAGMIHLYNAWSNNSIAWKVANVKDLDGKKITKLTFYMNDKAGNYFVYDVPVDVTIVPVYTGEVTAAFDDEKTVSVTGLPTDIANARAKVYLKGQGRGAKNTYLTAEELDPADGDIDPVDVAMDGNKITLNHETNKPEDGTTYTVVVASDNYAPITTTAEYKAAAEEPKQDEPKQDEPKQDEPKQDEPKQDEPAEVLNGLVQGPDGKWAMYKDGKVDTSATGVFQNVHGWWRVENGYVNFDAQGIYQNQYGWWKTTDGKVTFEETGVFQNENGWWRVEDSKVNFDAQGIYQNQYGWWKTTNGKVTFKEDGVYQNENGWWKTKDSKVDFSFTGVASNKYGTWYIKNGKVDFSKNGKVTVNGKTYTVKNGKVVK
ncbi:MAG: hypothetical protein IJ051_03235 [Clostridia bacterium]|nr:hypothetical protein [Clostridia bacterium]